jgi:molybdate transport system substrate-binding protein
MSRHRRVAAAALVCALVAALVQADQLPRVVRVAAASDLQFALAEIVTTFEAANPRIDIDVAYGSSGTYHAQILQRAPFDLFLSADMDYPRDLIAKGRGAQSNAFLYAIGRLVLWVPRRSPIDVERLGIEALKDHRIRHVAIANPRHAPYGRAAEAALRHYGIEASVRSKLVFGENVAQTAQFVESGAADVGIIARSLALAPPMRGKGRYWEIPAAAHPRMEQGGLILNAARDVEAARLFRDYLLSPAGTATLARYGFVLPTN